MEELGLSSGRLRILRLPCGAFLRTGALRRRTRGLRDAARRKGRRRAGRGRVGSRRVPHRSALHAPALLLRHLEGLRPRGRPRPGARAHRAERAHVRLRPVLALFSGRRVDARIQRHRAHLHRERRHAARGTVPQPCSHELRRPRHRGTRGRHRRHARPHRGHDGPLLRVRGARRWQDGQGADSRAGLGRGGRNRPFAGLCEGQWPGR